MLKSAKNVSSQCNSNTQIDYWYCVLGHFYSISIVFKLFFRVEMPNRCLARFDQHQNEVWFVVFSHNCEYIASSSKDKSIILWKVGPNGEFFESSTLVGHSEACSYVAWSLDDEYLSKNSKKWKMKQNNLKEMCQMYQQCS